MHRRQMGFFVHHGNRYIENDIERVPKHDAQTGT